MSRWSQDMFRETFLIIFAATSIGWAASASNRVLERLVQVAPASRISVLAVIVPVLMGVVLGAGYIAARRAAWVHPVVAQRPE